MTVFAAVISKNLNIEHGCDLTDTVVVKDNGNVVVDITGASAVMELRSTNSHSTDPAYLALSVGSGLTLTDAANGLITLHITAAQAAAFSWTNGFYDLVITLAGVKTKVQSGAIHVKPSVSV